MSAVQKFSLANREMDVHIFENGSQKQPAVIFLPDLTGVAESQLETARLLTLEGFHVFVPELFSHGGAPQYCLRMFFNMAFVTNAADNPGVLEVYEVIDQIKKLERLLIL